MLEILYHLERDTNANERQLNIWHKNILKFGTITNTIKPSCLLESTLNKSFL